MFVLSFIQVNSIVFMKYLSISLRAYYARAYRDGRMSVADIGRETNASPSAIYGWKKDLEKLERGVLQGLGDKSRIPTFAHLASGNPADATQTNGMVAPHAISPEEMALVEWLLQERSQLPYLAEVIERSKALPGYPTDSPAAQYKFARRIVAKHNLDHRVRFKRGRNAVPLHPTHKGAPRRRTQSQQARPTEYADDHILFEHNLFEDIEEPWTTLETTGWVHSNHRRRFRPKIHYNYPRQVLALPQHTQQHLWPQ
ncbi:Aste57867_23457 [Aphanomyces stellatus]|uniref:Aste57867_23457 protein n=1 Tax=Aphanomyces stellatus TaxID=120398 RepID=A0A485LMR5_9STRA|nr:hypothetical protein As57867_023386 [Aphanomyces stellatus]VFU00103.1 Aste57867_23457 [Aphanomyces stellatus]